MDAEAELWFGSTQIMKAYSGGDSRRPAVRVSISWGRVIRANGREVW
jgi:hypothetical protein